MRALCIALSVQEESKKQKEKAPKKKEEKPPKKKEEKPSTATTIDNPPEITEVRYW